MRLGELSRLGLALAAGGALSLPAQVSVLTAHNDNARTGLNPNEALLTHTNVSPHGFGKLFSQSVDGPVYAQPLYAPNVAIPGKGSHNVVLIATQHDSVYAFDADSGTGANAAPLWHARFINPAAGITAVPTADAVDYPWQDCQTFVGEIGIVGTPVIDASRGTLYVVARTKEPLPPPNNLSFVQVQRLHALNLATGEERPNSPVVISAAVPGTGDGSSNGFVPFNPARELQRAGLLWVAGVVYISWASYCDLDPYHGWIIGYDAQTLQQVAVFNATPNGSRGGLWMGGAAPAADADGAIYCVTGNGTFDPSGDPQDFGDSFLKLTPGTHLALTDYFTPFNQASLSSADEDLGSGGAVVLPDSVGSAIHPRLLAGCGKAGVLYLLDRDRLGHYLPTGDSQVVQEVPVYTSGASPHFFGLPAYFNGRLYLQPVGDPLKAFALSNGTLNATPVSQSADQEIGFRGATPGISANGTNDAVVWELVLVASGTASLRAYNADDLAQKLYDSYASAQAGAPDQISFVKFAVPTIANGKVYVGTEDSVAVFGLRFVLQSIRRDAGLGVVQLVFRGPAGLANRIEASADLLHWANLGPGTPTGTGTFSFTDSTAGGTAARFYRVVQP